MSERMRTADEAYYANRTIPAVEPATAVPEYPAPVLGSSALRPADDAYYRARRGSAIRPSLVQFHGEPAAPGYVPIPEPTAAPGTFPMTPAGEFPLEGPFPSVLSSYVNPAAGAASPAPAASPAAPYPAVNLFPTSPVDPEPAAPSIAEGADEGAGGEAGDAFDEGDALGDGDATAEGEG